MIPWDALALALLLFLAGLAVRHYAPAIVDRYVHHWEYPTQREYREYLHTLSQASPSEPYTLTSTSEVRDAGEWPGTAEQQEVDWIEKGRRADAARLADWYDKEKGIEQADDDEVEL